MNKQQIHQEVLAQFTEWYGEDHRKDSCCMYWAFIGGLVFQRHGIRAVLQAGTMLWPAFEDDGVSDTHFGYEWSPEHEASQAALVLGYLPEIHTWLAIPETREIVDFSVKWLPESAARDGKTWVKPAPPEFLWATKDEMPEGVIYRPKIEACKWILERLKKDGNIREVKTT